jgi:PAS domain S-box-containing protein
MKQKKDWIEKRQTLRTDADSALSSLSPEEANAQPADVMLHELLVHKVELEMQIEELQRAHIALEEARDRYAEYYEFAPVGYLSISAEGVITEVNLTGAALLGLDRAALIQRRFANFVSPRDRERWNCLFLEMMGQAEIEQQAVALQMTRADVSTFEAYLDCRRPHLPDAPRALRITLFDIGKLKPL